MAAMASASVALKSLCVAALLPSLAGCGQSEPAGQRVSGGDPDAGREVVATIECGVCHHIPGIPGADGIVGPSLDGFGQRQLIGGIVPNEPALLQQWVRDAPSLAPGTAMPALPLSHNEARDIAAFLYTLR